MDTGNHSHTITNPASVMLQDTAEHGTKDSAITPVRPYEGNSGQEERMEMLTATIVQDERQIELQKRNLELEEQLLETQQRNLALEEKLLEWQRRILAQDERLLEMQKRTEVLEKKRKDADKMMGESEATAQDIQANHTSFNKHSDSLNRSTITPSMDTKPSRESSSRIDGLSSGICGHKRLLRLAVFALSLCFFLSKFIDTLDHNVAASASLNEAIQYKTYCHAICEHKDRLWEASRIMRENEVHAFNNFAKLTESIRHSHTPDQSKYLKHRGELHTLQNDLNRYRQWEEKFETLYRKQGCDTEGKGHTDEGYLFLRRRHDQGRKVIEDILGEARKLVGPPDLDAIVRQDHRAGVIIALGCNP